LGAKLRGVKAFGATFRLAFVPPLHDRGEGDRG